MSRAFNKTLNIGQPVNRACSLNDGLVSWWMVHPGTHRGSILFRDLCNRNHGTLTNMAPATDWKSALGRPGGWGCLNFNGSDDYVLVDATSSLRPATVTVAAWTYATSWSEYQSITTQCRGNWQDGFGLVCGVNNLSGPGFWVNSYSGGGRVRITSPSTNVWKHLVGTYDLANVTLFVDGTSAASAAYSTAISYHVSGSQQAIGGTYNGSGDLYFGGYIDDVRVWNRALSASEVLALYNDSRQGYLNTLNWIRPTWYLDQAGGGGGGLGIPIAAYHYNHHLGTMAG